MQLSQGFTAEVKEEEEGGDVHGSGSLTLTEIQHQQLGWWPRVLGGHGAATSIPHPPGQPHPCVICSPGIPQRGFSLRFAL